MFSGLFLDSVLDVNAEVQLSGPIAEGAVLQYKWMDLQEISEKCETASGNVCQCRTVRVTPTGVLQNCLLNSSSAHSKAAVYKKPLRYMCRKKGWNWFCVTSVVVIALPSCAH